MIIFSEQEQYKELNKNGFSKFVNVRDLSILARHYYNEIKNDNILKSEKIDLKEDDIDKIVKERLISFCESKDKNFNKDKQELKIINAIRDCRSKGIVSEIINFYKSEIDKIKALKDNNLQKFMFIFLFLAKWQKKNHIYLNADSIISLSDICDLANINCSLNEQLIMLHDLYLKKYIYVYLKPLLKYDINILAKDNINEKPILSFKASQDAIYYYEQLCGKKIITCQGCGKLIKVMNKKDNARKYCLDCAKENKWHKKD